MKINILQLKRELGSTQSFLFKTSAEKLDLGTQPHIWGNGEMLVKGQIINKGYSYEVVGTINIAINLRCSRCLGDMTTELSIPFSEDYKEVASAESDEHSERELNYFSGDEIYITELVRENILLAEPLKPVCSENCRGLCPECGTNLNTNTCGCNPKKTDPRLAVLEKLLSKD